MKLKSYLPAAALLLTQSIGVSRANVVFNLIPEPGTPQYAMDGFAAAANRWSSVLADNITVNVQVGFVPLGQFVIGQAGSDFREYSYADTRTALGTRGVSAADVRHGAGFCSTESQEGRNRSGGHCAGDITCDPFEASHLAAGRANHAVALCNREIQTDRSR